MYFHCVSDATIYFRNGSVKAKFLYLETTDCCHLQRTQEIHNTWWRWCHCCKDSWNLFTWILFSSYLILDVNIAWIRTTSSTARQRMIHLIFVSIKWNLEIVRTYKCLLDSLPQRHDTVILEIKLLYIVYNNVTQLDLLNWAGYQVLI